MSADLKTQLERWRSQVEQTIEREMPPADRRPTVIHQAMRYAVLGGGKRLRPILAIAAADACGADPTPLLRPICALELIHTYSLVHDDLPSLDNDDLRRGRKTTHVVFGEAMAILAGDALLTEAFCWLTEPVAGVEPKDQLTAARLVARSVDASGMIGGQVADLEAESLQARSQDHAVLKDELAFIHRNKTGRLLTASLELGGVLSGAGEVTLGHLRAYGEAIGLAFQIVDDLLDVEGSAETLGKTAGKDVAQGKLTWPSLLGIEAARARVEELVEAAEERAAMIGRPEYLAPLARYIGARRS
jgi:geranylgeranyl diphosphate synthase, type II